MNPIEKMTDAEVKRKCEEICNLNCSSKLWTDDFTGALLERLREWKFSVLFRRARDGNSPFCVSLWQVEKDHDQDIDAPTLPRAFLLAAHTLGHWKPKVNNETSLNSWWRSPDKEAIIHAKVIPGEDWCRVRVIPWTKEGNNMTTLLERQAEFVYNAARIAAIGATAPVIPVPWDEREQPFKDQFLKVIERQCGPQRSSSPEELHGSWMQAYFAMGWVYGEKYDRENKIHPDLVPYSQLGPLERDKDAVFVALCEIARQWIYDLPATPPPPKDEK